MSSELNDFDRELLAQMREDFLAEAQEILDRLNTQLAQLEHESTPELINAVFREVHTLKGTAGFVSFTTIQQLSHELEDLFGNVRAGRLPVTARLIDVAFDATQSLIAIRADIVRGGNGQADIAPLVRQLKALASGHATELNVGMQASASPDSTQGAIGAEEARAASTSETTLRVDTEALDNLMTLVGELTTVRNALLANADRVADAALLDDAIALNRLTRQLQSAVSSVRLVPVERLLNRFTPVVRNLAREKGKQVRYVIEGGDTPLDRSVSEQMADPITHMLRNSIDHGLETPERRRALGKPETGTLQISAERRGDNVILHISDDGNGIDPHRVRAVAVERGLYIAEEAADLSDAEAVRLIFAPGFSTASIVTDLSGRGVGMDVVQEHVRRLRGSIDIETKRGHGTTFIIKVPITLAILQVLLVRASDHTYAVPMSNVIETLSLSPKSIHFLNRGAMTYVREAPLPVRRLADWLRPSDRSEALSDNRPAIVVHLTRGDEVVVVDELVGKQQMVVKPLSPFLGTVNGVEGAAVLPDGRVCLILDLERLIA